MLLFLFFFVFFLSTPLNDECDEGARVCVCVHDDYCNEEYATHIFFYTLTSTLPMARYGHLENSSSRYKWRESVTEGAVRSKMFRNVTSVCVRMIAHVCFFFV